MLVEKKSCAVCKSDGDDRIRCRDCDVALCSHHMLSHECGVDGRDPLAILLDGKIRECKDARSMILLAIGVAVIAYLPTGRLISRDGLWDIFDELAEKKTPDEVLASRFVELMRQNPIHARGCIAVIELPGCTSVAHSGGFSESSDLRLQFFEAAKLAGLSTSSANR